MNSFQFHIGDYLKDAGHLTLLEHGIYVRLMMVYYTNQSPIPADGVDLLARKLMARTPEEVSSLKAILGEFFTLTDGLYWHSRCECEIRKFRQFGQQQRERVQKRYQKSTGGSENPTGGSPRNTGGDPAEVLPYTNHKPLTINQEPLTIIPRETADVVAGAPKLSEEKQKRKRQLPEEWKPNENHSRIALENGKNLTKEAEMFRDHFLGKGVPMANWDLTFNNWLRRVPFGGRATIAEKKVSFTKEDHEKSQPLF